MIIKRIKKTENGMEATMFLDEAQVQFLLNFAIGFLVTQGVITFYDMQEGEEPQVTVEDKESADFLLHADPEKMFKA